MYSELDKTSQYALIMEAVDTPFDIEIKRKRIKNLYVRVSEEDGKVKVSVPVRTSLKDIHAFIRANSTWIYEQQQYVQSRRKSVRLPTPLMDGETCYLFGIPHRLTIFWGNEQEAVEHHDDAIIMRVALNGTQVQMAALLEAWYRRQLQSAAWHLVERYQVLMGVSVQEVRVRKMKTRWGSCNPSAARIWLNLELAFWPMRCVEYVVVHEMVHFLELSHNHRFKKLMSQFLPDWKERGKQLKAGFFE